MDPGVTKIGSCIFNHSPNFVRLCIFDGWGLAGSPGLPHLPSRAAAAWRDEYFMLALVFLAAFCLFVVAAFTASPLLPVQCYFSLS